MKNYFDDIVITEALHNTIVDILNSTEVPIRHKNTEIARNVRKLISNGEDTGLEDAKPKKGSSRAVYFPSEPKKVNIDGVDTHMHTALKVAFAGTLDKYHGEDTLLGEDQNEVESDKYNRNSYGILSKHSDNTFSTNHERGVFAPVVDAHSDHEPEKSHWIEFGKISKPDASEFKRLTKTDKFPKGICHKEFYDAVNRDYSQANGGFHYSDYSDEHLENLRDHPFVDKVLDATYNTGMHPADLHKANMGVWEHPVTKEKHLVISDYGFRTDIAKKYSKARRNIYKRW